MPDAAERHVCPHCKKPFDAGLLGQDTARAGYKCPHCRLFIPVERADPPAEHEAA